MQKLSFLACCVVALGCTGSSEATNTVTSRSAKGPSVASKAPAKTTPVAPAQPDNVAPTAEAKPEDLGQRFVDPRWFRKEMFPDAAAVDFKRSKADDNGFFSSQLLFDLKEGTTTEDCVKVLETQVGAEVALTRTEQNGRVTLKGATARFTVVALCGEAKGVMKAYVSYQWTAA